MSNAIPPFSLSFDLGNVSERGAEIAAAPNAAERAAIAAFIGASALERFTATIRLSRSSGDSFAYDANFTADVVQDCGVTLEPVRSHLEGAFTRRYRLLPKPSRRHRPVASIDVSDTGDDELEVLASPHVDLAAPLLEELSLALDPYPRAPGVAFEAPQDDTAPSENPFAVLAKLKARLEPKTGPSGPNKAKGKAKK
jgi:uncharacterized metal-binding protein YceD (DUF177 family)